MKPENGDPRLREAGWRHQATPTRVLREEKGGLPVSITKIQFSTGLARFVFEKGLQVVIRGSAAVKPAVRGREPVLNWPETRAIKIDRPRHAVQKCAITPAMGRMLSKS
jgi:hypothetical protein